MSKAQKVLQEFNQTYEELHQKFEEAFWDFQMGDHAKGEEMNLAEKDRNFFRSNPDNLVKIAALFADTETLPKDRERLKIWQNFFALYQTPPQLIPIKDKIAKLESDISQKLSTRKEGYKDPKTGEFITASKLKMRMLMRTSPDEDLRKACFDALEELNGQLVKEYIEIVSLRNEYARALGFEDFYAYRLNICEGMTKKQVFDLFDEIYKGTMGTFNDIRELEKSRPRLRKPWNFGFMMAGEFTHEEDPYYNFDKALTLWGRSFSALGIDYKGGALQLDLLDRKGKYNNGFCHYCKTVNFNTGKRDPGASNFTCNVVYGQIGTGFQGMDTLFHEGGHAADRLNAEQSEVCLNTEWPPASIAWAETHSQFLDEMFSSIEWRVRYAKNEKGDPYPWDLFERKLRKLRILAPLGLHHIMFVSEFEKIIYESKNLTAEEIIEVAKSMHRKYFDFSEDSLSALSVPHIYSWDSSAYYHAYGLAILALQQWRKYFYDKYGYIVDNPEVGREMTAVWELASSKNFAEFVKLATGEDLSPKAFLEDANMSIENYLETTRKRIDKLSSVPEYNKPVQLNAQIKMVHGKELIADNSLSFEDMAQRYKDWLHKQQRDS